MAKARVIISSDIGGADPDDFESMVHAFLAADRYEIEGLISTPSRHGGRTSDIHKVIDTYAKDYANLKTWSSDYPTAGYLKSVVKQGSIDVHSKGYGSPTEGSKHIIRKAHESDEPLWVLTWGSMTDLAQALHDDPSITGKIKVYSIGSWNTKQDPAARDYIYNNFKDLWWIENNSTFRGMYADKNGAEANAFRMSDAKDHGALGDLFHDVRPWGIKMGDTPSLLRLIDGNGSNDSNPSAESWGGAFKKTGHGPNYWTDDPHAGLKAGHYNGAKTVQKHQAEIYKDMAKLFDRADAPNPKNAPQDDPADKPSSGNDQIASGSKLAPSGSGSSGHGKGDAGSNAESGPTASSPGGARSVNAYDDQYALDSGSTLWFNARYLTWNDKDGNGKHGADGGLKVTDIGDTTAAGVEVSMAGNGTIVYKAPAGWEGTDSLTYTVRDKAGHTDTAEVFLKVGHGKDGLPSGGGNAGDAAPPSSGGGAGAPVVAVDDHHRTGEGKTLWFNSRHLTDNDKGADGGLDVIELDSVSKAGVKVSWGPEGSKADGTAIYKPKPGWEGIDSLSYTVADRDGSTDTGTVYIHVGAGDLLFA